MLASYILKSLTSISNKQILTGSGFPNCHRTYQQHNQKQHQIPSRIIKLSNRS